jgi:hypothetical protein
MRKELIIKIIIEGDNVGSIIHKSGFKDDVNSKYEVIGILNKIIFDEQLKLDNKLKLKKDFIIKTPLDTDEKNKEEIK